MSNILYWGCQHSPPILARLSNNCHKRLIYRKNLTHSASDEFDTEIIEDDFRDAMFVNNIYIFINGRNSEFSFDLDAEPDYLCGHLANMIVSSNYEIECDGLNG